MDEVRTAYEDTPNTYQSYYSSATTNTAGDTATQAFRKYPNFVETMRSRAERYNKCRDRLFELEKEGRVLVIAPEDTLGCSRTEKDPEILRALWQQGSFAGRRLSGQVKEFWEA